MLDCFGALVAVGYFMLVSNYIIGWEVFALFVGVTSMIITYLLVPESPVFLYDKGNISGARQILLLIAHNNGI